MKEKKEINSLIQRNARIISLSNPYMWSQNGSTKQVLKDTSICPGITQQENKHNVIGVL